MHTHTHTHTHTHSHILFPSISSLSLPCLSLVDGPHTRHASTAPTPVPRILQCAGYLPGVANSYCYPPHFSTAVPSFSAGLYSRTCVWYPRTPRWHPNHPQCFLCDEYHLSRRCARAAVVRPDCKCAAAAVSSQTQSFSYHRRSTVTLLL